MKTSIFYVLIILALPLSICAQDNDLLDNINALKGYSSSTEYIDAGAKFGHLAPINNEDWYPNYYAAYSYSLAAYTDTNIVRLDSILDLAQSHIEKAMAIVPKNDEVLCVLSMIYSARILVNPAKRGFKFGTKSQSTLNKALRINPNNPRALYLIAQSKMYMPVAYGGGCENAKPYIEEALDNFATFKSPDDFYPNWGLIETKQLKTTCP